MQRQAEAKAKEEKRKAAGPDFEAMAKDPAWLVMEDARSGKRIFLNLRTNKTVKER